MRTIEDVFRFIKSDLGMRPVYYQKEQRIDGHLWITVMAYHLIQCIHHRLRKNGISYHGKTILNKMSSRVRVTMKAETEEGNIIYHRSTTKSKSSQNEIYQSMRMSLQILQFKKLLYKIK